MEDKIHPDRRIQRTRQLLLNSLLELILEKGYESITVQDIIDRANVGRSTFYFHFQDKEELLLSGFENMRQELDDFRSHSLTNQSNWDFSLALFEHAAKQRRVFKALLGEKAGNVVLHHIQKILFVMLREHFQAVFPKNKEPIPLEIFVRYFLATFLEMLTWWLDDDVLYTAAEMNRFFQVLTEPTIQSLLGEGNS